jgi:hypothetical protein
MRRNGRSAFGVDAAFEHTLRYSKPELLSRPVLEITHPDDVKGGELQIETSDRGGTVVEVRLPLFTQH